MKIKIHCAHDKLVALDKLKPHPANPNKHPEQQIALLTRIESFLEMEQAWQRCAELPSVENQNRLSEAQRNHTLTTDFPATAPKCSTFPHE